MMSIVPISDAILVAYASRTGSTRGVAEAIGRTMAGSGVPVEVHAMQDVDDIAPYRAVVAGSAIRSGRWLPEALRFLQRHHAALAQKPRSAWPVSVQAGFPGLPQPDVI